MTRRATAVFLLVGWAAVFCAVSISLALPIDIPITAEPDDGEELNDLLWVPTAPTIRIGATDRTTVQDLGLRFHVPGLTAGEKVLFARLRFDSQGGAVIDSLRLTVTGALETSSPPLSPKRRPSLLPRTKASTTWTIKDPWADGHGNSIFYYTADLSEILTEITGQPGWPADSAALVLRLDAETVGGAFPNFVACRGFGSSRWPITLQVCRTLEETFIAHETVGRPTDVSATVHFMSLVALEAYAEYGTDGSSQSTPTVVVPAEQPGLLELTGLSSNALCHYRLRYRLAGSADAFTVGPEHSFHTQRTEGAPFTFTTEADSHLWDRWQDPVTSADVGELYTRVLNNVAADSPDFHFSLGDYSNTEYSNTQTQAIDRYLIERRFQGQILHSIPFFFVLGNHEGEQGWRRSPPDSVMIWSERSRKMLIANPRPDRFYTGCPDSAASGPGRRESYYAWEWGDALFVVLDPFWYTMTRPYHLDFDWKSGGTGWDWTLGPDQYEWLYRTLQASTRRWKIVLLHHVAGGVQIAGDVNGRGGIEVAKWRVAQRPTFEWGGEDEAGMTAFPLKRPGWLHGPVHDLLVDNGVNLVIHGHDHLCAIQQLDGITYALCPTPTDLNYNWGYLAYAGYVNGTLLPNTGHLRFQVSSDDIVIDYVRAYLDGDGVNGEVAVSYSLAAQSTVRVADRVAEPQLRISPNPATGGAPVLFGLPSGSPDLRERRLDIFDPSGRLCVSLRPQAEGKVLWDGKDERGRPVTSGIYYCVSRSPGGTQARSMVVIR